MDTAPQQGFYVNSKTITAIVGVCTIVASLFAVFDRISKYEYRLDRIEYSDSLKNNEIKILTSELKALNVKLTDLTIELREMRATQKAGAIYNEKEK